MRRCRSGPGTWTILLRTDGRLLVAAVLLAGAVPGCGDSIVSPGPAAHFTLVSGAGQSGMAAETLATPLAVSLRDDGGRPVPGVAVAWSSSEAGGRFVPATVLTDRDGIARTRWVLGSSSGVQVAEAGAEGWDGHLAVSAEVRPGLKAVSLMRGNPFTHMCALDAAGEAWCWGRTAFGLLGDGVEVPVTEHLTVPVKVAGGHRFTLLTGGFATSCGITESGEALCWGLLPSDGTVRSTPTPVAGSLQLRSLSVEGMICGVSQDAEGFCWGPGVLGDGQPRRTSAVPVPVGGGHSWLAIAVNRTIACGVTVDGATLCWGDGAGIRSELGLAGDGPLLIPEPVTILPALDALSVGGDGQCGLAGTGGLCWGETISGAWAGSGPFFPAEHTAFHQIVASGSSYAALTASGHVLAWGSTPVSDGADLPGVVLLPHPGPWADLSVGPGAVAILARDSTVHAWTRFDDPGQPGLPLPVPQPLP